MGVDLDAVANRRFDSWSKPDVLVTCRHNGKSRSTQVEENTLRPRFLWQAKMPWKKKKGFGFTVYDVNVIKGDEVMGRAFISAEKAAALIESEEPAVLSIGDGVGFIKVNIFQTPVNLTEKFEESDITISTHLTDANALVDVVEHYGGRIVDDMALVIKEPSSDESHEAAEASEATALL